MAKMFQVYGIGQALIPVLPPPIPFQNAPTTTQTNYEIGQLGFTGTNSASAFYIYGGGGNWVEFASNSGAIIAINGTANQVTVSTTLGTATVSLPSAITAPGSLTTTTSLSATTTVTAGTDITATTGNITATAGAVSAGTTVTGGTGLVATTGNVTVSGTGSGLLLTPVVVGAGASPQTANGRVFSVTFSGVSIAAGATQSFVIDNSAVNTLVQLSMVGATAGAALSIVSVTNSAGVSTTVVVTNGAGATTSTANITFTGFCVN
jgi:hypothetical protein